MYPPSATREINTTEEDYTARSSSDTDSEDKEDTDLGKTETRTRKKKTNKKTYAQATSNTQRNTDKPWKTPEHTPRYEAVIRLKENEDARDTIKKIKEIAKEELKVQGG